MGTNGRKVYEGMFLVDAAQAASDWDEVNAAIRMILERNDAEIVSMRKWNECTLAYEIDGKDRGAYILCYFKVNGRRIREIEREIQLSERVMRALILNAEHISCEDIEKQTDAATAGERREIVQEAEEPS